MAGVNKIHLSETDIITKFILYSGTAAFYQPGTEWWR